MVGPVIDADTTNAIHTSPFGPIPKQHQPGKWRLIVNLSFPKSTIVLMIGLISSYAPTQVLMQQYKLFLG